MSRRIDRKVQTQVTTEPALIAKTVKICTGQFCVAIFETLHTTHGKDKNLNTETETSKQILFAISLSQY